MNLSSWRPNLAKTILSGAASQALAMAPNPKGRVSAVSIATIDHSRQLQWSRTTPWPPRPRPHLANDRQGHD